MQPSITPIGDDLAFVNTPIELTETSTGLDVLNETRRAFSIYLYQELKKIINLPKETPEQATILSRHITQRLGTMRVLTVLNEQEVNAASQHIKTAITNNDESVAIVFGPVKDSQYQQYSAGEMFTMFNAILQHFFTHCLTLGARTQDESERERLYSFAENAVFCWHDLKMMMPEEINKAQDIVNEFRKGNTTIDTKYSGSDIPDVTIITQK